ncbi:hypothetical protein [Aurantimonas sp. VKM B-3413]|uniref:hypothetical protein n=1 Tax=Aurantimonas sp. VKM B-3413 TaxID=2779401 RepID=UPI001E42F068|nr:hypothetical protein [Aurantimonas sp. VKM B-3413]MCB8839367.1 hypothetical protein [Aurantimonas sp. VKM B-3413]
MGVTASLTIASGYLNTCHGFEARVLRLRHPLAALTRMPFRQIGALTASGAATVPSECTLMQKRMNELMRKLEG